ncbi:PREDICTED: synaptonemal complex protein 1-like [Erythranthe guttata]|uniref:synaptonemal complex protein 1-like n=1 Tax=Erythranthe guttata TaxID=4155 RepID=UPI00064DAC47|nr:PREDICTED: synaptonemal complex protein 1-like [Erythranthe guttata]|eukprot:XP_012844568.1 PREDICTED: synaptonemal complex protein 1-like [Erythranthe guttata]
MTNFFFTTSQSVNWSYFQYVDDLQRINDFNWAEEVVKFFMNSVHKVTAKAKSENQPIENVVDSVHGCVTLLLMSAKPLAAKRYETQLLGQFQNEEEDVDDNEATKEQEEQTVQRSVLIKARSKGKRKLVDEPEGGSSDSDEAEDLGVYMSGNEFDQHKHSEAGNEFDAAGSSKTQVTNLSSIIEGLESENKILREQVSEQQSSIEKLQGENVTLIGQITALNVDIDERLSKEEEAALRNKIKNLEETNKIQEQDLARLIDIPTNSQIEAYSSARLERQVQELKTKLTSAIEKNTLNDHEIATLRAQNNVLTKERDAFVCQPIEPNDDVNKSQTNSDTSFSSIQELHCQVVELKQENEKLCDENKQLKTKFEDMEQNLQAFIDSTLKEEQKPNDVDTDFADPQETMRDIGTKKTSGVHKRTRSKLNQTENHNRKSTVADRTRGKRKEPALNNNQPEPVKKKRRKDFSYQKGISSTCYLMRTKSL